MVRKKMKGRDREEEGIFWLKKISCNLSPTFSWMAFTFHLSLADICSAPTIFVLTSLGPGQALDLHICGGPNSQIHLGEVLRMRSGIRNVVWIITSETLIKKVSVCQWKGIWYTRGQCNVFPLYSIIPTVQPYSPGKTGMLRRVSGN